MDFGSTIRAAREARGLTTSQLAAQTRILVQIIDEMEQNKFKRIPAPIYGRGFVKLICECLDLDPVQMVPAFMSAYNGEPQVPDEPESPNGGIRYARPEKPYAPPPPPPAQPQQPEPQAVLPQEEPSATAEPPPAVDPQPAESAAEVNAPTEPDPPAEVAAEPPPNAAVDSSLKGLELFDPPSVAPAPAQPAAPEPPVQQAAPANDFSRFAPPSKDDSFSRFAPPSAEDDFSRFASPMPYDDTPDVSPMERFRESFSSVSSGVLGHMKKIRRPAFRMTLLAIGLLLVLALCGWGIVALFRATSSSGKEVTSQETPSAEVQEKTDAAKAQPSAAPAVDEKTEGEETPGAATVPTRSTVPLKLPGFYID